MVYLACDCMNIRVHTKGSTLNPVDLTTLNLSNEQLSDPFFKNGAYTVHLDIAGITKQVPCLLKMRTVGDWNIHTCINCHLDGFALHVTRGLDNVLISQKLQSNHSELSQKMKSEYYSPLYKIILHYSPESPSTYPLNFSIHTRQSETLENALSVLQQQITKYLRTEQEDMDERIKSYIDQQKDAYNALQNRVRQDKQAIIRLLQEAEEEDLQNSLSEAMIDSNGLTPPMTPVNTSNQHSMSPLNNAESRERLNSEEQDTVINDIPKPSMNRQRPQSFSRPLHGKLGYRKKVTINPPRIAQSLDSDGIFQLEGMDEELVVPFYHSEDDNDKTDGEDLSDNNNDDVFGVDRKETFQHFPLSLPVNVPIHDYHHHRSNDDITDQVLAGDFDKIAASFKALARSVRANDTTAMFGELPRPRLNTMH